jgi:predicted nucleic acid-binding protein
VAASSWPSSSRHAPREASTKGALTRVPLLVDTGVIYALADRNDAWHERCVAFLAVERERLLVPVTVLPEISYLLQTRLGSQAEGAFVRSLVSREFDVEALKDRDVSRAAEILERYPAIGFVDATLVAIAERLKLTRLATTDRRHFARISPDHIAAFELVPKR